MSKCILIDNESLRFLKATETVEQAEYWADLLVPTSDFTVLGTDNRDYSCYTAYELRTLYSNTRGEFVPEDITYSTVVKGVAEIARQLIVDTTSVEELRLRLGYTIQPTEPKPAPEKKSTTKRQATNSGHVKHVEYKRPKAGTSTGLVWDIADNMYGADPGLGYQSKEFKECVITQCLEKGINPSTAQTQFNKWRKQMLRNENAS